MSQWDFPGPHVDDWGFEQDTSHVVWRGEWSKAMPTEDEKIQAAKEMAALDLEFAVVKLQMTLSDALSGMAEAMKEMTQKFEELGQFLEGIEPEEIPQSQVDFMAGEILSRIEEEGESENGS